MLYTVFILLALALATPLFIVIAGITMAIFHTQEIDLSVIPGEIYRITDTPILLALPLFTLAGYILAESQASQRLMRVTQAFLGWMPGGMAIIAFISSAIFTAFTGASGVTIVALGALLYPALIAAGYREKFALGLVTTSGSLGLLIVPSLPLILYGIVAQQMHVGETFTLQQLFLAGAIPALLMLFLLSVWAVWTTRRQNVVITPFSWPNVKDALWEARWEVPLPFIVLGGIYGGYLVVSDAAVITLFYVIIAETLLYREVPLKKLPKITLQAMTMVGGLVMILAVSLALTNALIDAEVPTQAFDWVRTHIDSKWTFLIALNIFLLILGMLLEVLSAIVVIPLILPIAVAYGIHPLHLGTIFLANMQIGFITPPAGMNLFIASYRFQRPITELVVATVPFMLVLLVGLILITYIPALSLWLPNLILPSSSP